MWTNVDKLNFRGNDYSPNTLNVTVVARNTSKGNDTVRNLQVCMRIDTRFIVKSNSCSPKVPALLAGDSISFTFKLNIASERKTDGYDTIRAVTTADNAANSVTCEYPVWVEHEYFPVYNLICTQTTGPLVFDDNLNDYNPNPFNVKLDIQNIGDGASEETSAQYLGTRGVSLDTTDISIKDAGTLNQNDLRSLLYSIRAIKRNNDTTISLCFQVQGKGGYKRKIYVDTCCVDVFIPRAKQAEYNIICNIVPDSINFIQHRYQPDPFDFTADIENIGTANGKNVKAQIVLPPSVQLAPGETGVKSLGDLATGNKIAIRWALKPTVRFARETATICVAVFDEFDNRGLCCDSVIIDSVRSAQFNIACICPDTIRMDPVRGIYDPDSFLVRLTVCNVGSDYADSVKATIIINTPDVVGVEPFVPIKRKFDYSSPQTDTLGVNSCFDFTWWLRALPRGVSGNVTIKFKVEAMNAPTEECECVIYIPKLETPDLELACKLIPDSVKYDPNTGGYSPTVVVFHLEVRNPGGGQAKDVQATLQLPPDMLLDTGETLTKLVTPQPIDRGTVSVAEWRVIPRKREDFAINVVFKVDVVSSNVDGRFSCQDTLFVPVLPKTIALVLPQDRVGFTGEIVKVPIKIDDPEGKNITSFDLRLDYNVDETRNPIMIGGTPVQLITLEGEGYDKTGTLLGAGWQVDKIKQWSATHFQITATSTGAPLTGSSTTPLLYLVFKVAFGGTANTMLDNAVSQILWPPSDKLLDSVKVNNGAVYPRVIDGKFTVAGECLRWLEASDQFVISQSKPNPFNPTTEIRYGIPEATHVKLTVFDALGRLVRTLVDKQQESGAYSVIFDATGLQSGIYFYRMETPRFQRTMKMILSK